MPRGMLFKIVLMMLVENKTGKKIPSLQENRGIPIVGLLRGGGVNQ
jgi:hypothetical protein